MDDDLFFRRELAMLRKEFAFAERLFGEIKRAFALGWMEKSGFHPDQPRVPAGNPDGGQWARGGVPPSWGRAETFERHFKIHGQGVGASTPEEYARMAREFYLRGQNEKLPTLTTRDGYMKIYDPTAKRFGVYSPSGKTETYLKVRALKYFIM